jgi:hypothetical protein
MKKMKWINGLDKDEKISRKQEWHRWFAWFPVTVDLTNDGHKIKIWLGYVERKGVYNHYRPLFDDFYTYEYREVKNECEESKSVA